MCHQGNGATSNLSFRKEGKNVDGLMCQVWTLFQDLDNMHVYIPDFNLFHTDSMPAIFFRKVEQKGLFVWREETIAKEFEEDYNEETNDFEEAMLKLIGIGLDCLKVGMNGQLFHMSMETYETISKSFL